LLVLKNIHDRLNAEGVEVKNAKGMAWRTYGDAHLKLGRETQRIAALAVYCGAYVLPLVGILGQMHDSSGKVRVPGTILRKPAEPAPPPVTPL